METSKQYLKPSFEYIYFEHQGKMMISLLPMRIIFLLVPRRSRIFGQTKGKIKFKHEVRNLVDIADDNIS